MNKKILKYTSFILLFNLFLFLLSCDVTNNNSNNRTDFDSMEIPLDFNYTSSRIVEVELSVNIANKTPISNIVFRVYDKHPDDDGNLIFKGATDVNGELKTKLRIPTQYQTLTVIGFMSQLTLPIADNQVKYDFGITPRSSTIFSDMLKQSKSYNFLPWYTYSPEGEPSPMGHMTIDAGLITRINNALPEYTNIPNLHPEYFASSISKETILQYDSHVDIVFLHEGAAFKNTYGFFTYNDISSLPSDPDDILKYIAFPNLSFNPLETGDSISIGDYTSGTHIGHFIIQNAWQHDAVIDTTFSKTFYSIPSFNPDDYQQHLILYDGITETVILTFEDIQRPNGDQDFNDAIITFGSIPPDGIATDSLYHISEPVDNDGDGIPNDEDDYPDDPERAFNNYYPGEGVYGSIAFEDNWPKLGDYDFNDIVIDFNVLQVTNAQNELVDIKPDLKLRAVGAGFHNGFGIQLPTASSNYSFFSNEGNGHIYIDEDCDSLVVICFEDAFDLMSDPTGGTWVNTDESEPYIDPVSFSFTLTLENPLPLSELTYLPPYNPFIIANGNRDKEIHLANYPPTSAMSDTYFGEESDDSDPETGRYFKTSDNYPWAVSVPNSWLYPSEKSEITWAYLKFAPWAESGGTNFDDWYDSSQPDYADFDYIYEQP